MAKVNFLPPPIPPEEQKDDSVWGIVKRIAGDPTSGIANPLGITQVQAARTLRESLARMPRAWGVVPKKEIMDTFKLLWHPSTKRPLAPLTEISFTPPLSRDATAVHGSYHWRGPKITMDYVNPNVYLDPTKVYTLPRGTAHELGHSETVVRYYELAKQLETPVKRLDELKLGSQAGGGFLAKTSMSEPIGEYIGREFSRRAGFEPNKFLAYPEGVARMNVYEKSGLDPWALLDFLLEQHFRGLQ